MGSSPAKTYTHTGLIQYELDVKLQSNVLSIMLTISQDKRVKRYKDYFINSTLPSNIREEVKTVATLYIILEDKRNFILGPQEGEIILFLRKMDGDELSGSEYSLNLNYQGEKKEKFMEGNCCEEFCTVEIAEL